MGYLGNGDRTQQVALRSALFRFDLSKFKGEKGLWNPERHHNMWHDLLSKGDFKKKWEWYGQNYQVYRGKILFSEHQLSSLFEISLLSLSVNSFCIYKILFKHFIRGGKAQPELVLTSLDYSC